MSVDEEKQDLRRIAREGRSGWAKAAGDGAGEHLKENFLRIAKGSETLPGASGIIAGFWPMADEINVRPLITGLHEDGRAVALPVVVGNAKPLIFRAWRPGLPLDDGGFGTRHPSPEEAEVQPSILLVPLLAFDAHGHRLGWGGGFYDRTIAQLRSLGPVVTVGVAYQAQRVDSVPHTNTDEPLDWMVTDGDVLEITRT
jgi:5-formyltetrahydrofolate cyclo-ligase